MVDLHIHSTMSDGQYSPDELVRMAKQKSIDTLAITDHDTVSGVEKGSLTAQRMGLKFIPGIEISVQCSKAESNRELHILGYCIDIYNAELLSLCESVEQQRRERELRIYKYLQSKGIDLSEFQVEKYVKHGRTGRPHFAMAMLDAGYIDNYRDAFDLYLATPEFDVIERPKLDARKSIEIIRNAGGVSVLAHPGNMKITGYEFDKLIKQLISYGLTGIECYYSTHTAEQTEYYISIANKYKLIVTVGSDYHGDNIKQNIEMGTGINGSLCFEDENIASKLWEAAKDGRA